MTDEPRRYVQPEVGEARVNRLWLNVADRLDARPSRFFRYFVLSAALSGVAFGGIWLVESRVAPSASSGEQAVLTDAQLETAAAPLGVTLVDGSQVQLGSRTALKVQGNQTSTVALALALSRGEVVCDVTHREGRKFTVLAGDVEVRVVGTKFSVKMTPGESPRVEVSVLRGVVEIVSRRKPGVVAHIAAGQSWLQAAGAVAEAALEPPTAKAEPSDAAEAPSVAVVPDGVAPKPESQTADAAPPSSAKVVPSARELFEKAGESRRAGDARAAAHAYEDLLRLHPSDGRASLSAFELGRLRMDRLGDPAGGVAALERALSLNVGPSFREDALARLVSGYASLGDFAACGRARDRYLSSYPSGVHAGAVATRCGAR